MSSRDYASASCYISLYVCLKRLLGFLSSVAFLHLSFHLASSHYILSVNYLKLIHLFTPTFSLPLEDIPLVLPGEIKDENKSR